MVSVKSGRVGGDRGLCCDARSLSRSEARRSCTTARGCAAPIGGLMKPSTYLGTFADIKDERGLASYKKKQLVFSLLTDPSRL